jgi:purine nucleosidase
VTRDPLKVVIDTDPGLGEPGSDIDDGLAIALALRSPEIDVRGLTIVNGNVDLDTGVDVARRLLHRLDHPDLPVVRGAARPLVTDMASVRELFHRTSGARPRVAAAERLGPTTDVPAAQFLVETAASHPGEVTVVAIGPMTNLALALRLDPRFATDVKELVLMAGSGVQLANNVTVTGDFNSYVDPEALHIVLGSGAPVRMVGIDQTSRVMLSRDDARDMRQSSEFGAWVADRVDGWIDFLGTAFPNRPEHQDACFLHDPLVVAAVIDPTVCTWAEAHAAVELAGARTRGQVLTDVGLALAPAGPANVTFARDTDVGAFDDLFRSRMGVRTAWQ